MLVQEMLLCFVNCLERQYFKRLYYSITSINLIPVLSFNFRRTMNYKKYQNIIAAAIAVTTGIVFTMTVQSSVSFWDCGECSAAAVWMQVAHPPGAPFFNIIGRF